MDRCRPGAHLLSRNIAACAALAALLLSAVAPTRAQQPQAPQPAQQQTAPQQLAPQQTAPQQTAPQAAPQAVPVQPTPQATPLPPAAQPRRATSAPAGQGAALRSSAPVTVNFVNADIEAVTRAMAVMIDRQIIVDPRVKGTITVYSEQPIPVREAYLNYLAALRGLGFTLVDASGLLKVVPEADAKLQTGTVEVGPPATRGDQVLTQIFRLNHENPNNLVAVLRPLISPNNTINANPGNNTLIITDYADNLQRIGRIIAALDTPGATDVKSSRSRTAWPATWPPSSSAWAMARSPARPPGGGAGGAFTVLVDPRANALIVRAANPVRMAQVRALIQRQLDQVQPGVGAAGNIWWCR
jgi:general secretion pathway protein D